MPTPTDNSTLAPPRHRAAPVAVASPDSAPSLPSWVTELVPDQSPTPANGQAAPGDPALDRRTRQAGSACLTSLRWRNADALDPAAFRAASLRLYEHLHAALRSLPAPHPVRIWNFIPSIHAPAGPPHENLDRYRVFNLGRFDAFESWVGEAGFSRALPTATGVGHSGHDLVVHALSASVPGRPVDNPRQRPAYQYSARYGPRPPCFARATVARVGERRLVLVGGTASVVGEDSTHAQGGREGGSLQHQLAETIENLRAVLRAAGIAPDDSLARIRHARAYCPRAEDLPEVSRGLAAYLSPATLIEPVRADICRRELLVEIEAIAELPPDLHPRINLRELAMTIPDKPFDVLVVGGGPAGSIAALRAARNGLSVLLLEKDEHPRFHIGESFLPRTQQLLSDLGLEDRLEAVPRVPKFGTSFAIADGSRTNDFWFSPGPRGECAHTFSIERAPFDRMLWDAAIDAGATALASTTVKSIDTLADGDVALTTSAGPVRGRILLDASGQGTLVGRHLGTRRRLPDLERIAYFQHFTSAKRRPGRLAGSPTMVMCREGWFWIIPIDDTRTSIGLVMPHDLAKTTGVAPREMLRWGIARAPFVHDICSTATAPAGGWNHVCADFSYRCEPFAGPGYFLLGDAATFIDPIFSTGVTMGMMSGVKAADAAAAIILRSESPCPLRQEYTRYIDGSSSAFFSLVRNYYRHGFREMFLHGTGPVKVHWAILQALAGHVFPRPVFHTRWRLQFFRLLLAIHEHKPLVPTCKEFSLFESTPQPSAWAGADLRSPEPEFAGVA